MPADPSSLSPSSLSPSSLSPSSLSPSSLSPSSLSPSSLSPSSLPSELATRPGTECSWWTETALWLTLAAGLHAAALFNAVPLQSANDRSRWATVWSLTEQGTFVIDAIDAVPAWQTIDKVQHEGHLYSSKPALLAVLAAGIAWLVEAVAGLSLYQQTATVARCVLLLLNLVPFLLGLLALSAVLDRHARTAFGRRLTLATAAFGTFLSPFLTTLNNHTVAAFSLLWAIFFTVRILEGSRRSFDYAACGLCAAFVTANELPAAAFGLGLFGLLMWRGDRRRTLLVFVPAALLVVAVFLGTTVWQTGSLKPFYTAYGTEKYLYIRNGLPSYWTEPHGFDRNLDSPLVYFLNCTIGHHGIFSLSPIFLLCLAGWWRWRRVDRVLQPLVVLGLLLTGLVLVFYLSRTENYNYGGNTSGLRWTFWLIPFWLLALVPVFDACASRRWQRWAAMGLLAVSVCSAWSAVGNPWRPAWLYTAMQAAGWTHDEEPPPPLPRAFTTWFASLPPAGADPAQHWIELSAPTADGDETLRLALVSAAAERVTLRLTHTTSLGQQITTATLSRQQFDAGADLEQCVLEGDGSQAAAVLSLRLLPKPITYRPGPVRYWKLPLRELAFRAQHIAATADARDGRGPVMRHRIDAWQCEDVPFGVVRLRLSASEAVSHESRSLREFVLTGAGQLREPAWPATVAAQLKPR